MVMNISCKFEKASCNIFFIRAVTANNKGGILASQSKVPFWVILAGLR